MWKKLNRWLDIVESRVSLWQIGQTAIVLSSGGLTGWLSSGLARVEQYGAFGWWAAFLLGALVASLVLLLFAGFRYLWKRGSALEEWSKRTDGIDPMEDVYRKKRIFLGSLKDPGRKKVCDKTFVDCDLVGPLTIALMGKTSVNGTHFIDCDVIQVRSGVPMFTAIALEDVTVTRGRMINLTVLIPEDQVGTFEAMGAKPIGNLGRSAMGKTA
ncbi:hypothetical protein [Acidimangrovimonas sediminis]|uniref:hypothetical protein n=1 Tax=Acidimangrovimonas sediminis TaxID=2056283 RepID=UPI0011AF0431|nr:hypothetical protein [Acidimangrovimonas sediminis]